MISNMLRFFALVWTARWVAWMRVLFSKASGPFFMLLVFQVLLWRLASWALSSSVRSLYALNGYYPGVSHSSVSLSGDESWATFLKLLGILDYAVDINAWMSAVSMILAAWCSACVVIAYREHIMLFGLGGGGVAGRR